jgi:hypothetical protein
MGEGDGKGCVAVNTQCNGKKRKISCVMAMTCYADDEGGTRGPVFYSRPFEWYDHNLGPHQKFYTSFIILEHR